MTKAWSAADRILKWVNSDVDGVEQRTTSNELGDALEDTP